MLRISITLLLACASAVLLAVPDEAAVALSAGAVCVGRTPAASGASAAAWTLGDCRSSVQSKAQPSA
jgi:hypothetical protein